jgi:quercetin dioxygenase-like cupin family protein
MKITNVSQVPLEQVQMPGAEGCAYRVAISSKDGAPNFAMRFFEVAGGGHTPLHQHPYEHEVFILEGQGTVWREGQEVALQPGDVLFVPADEKHQFKNTATGTLKFMCLIPAQFQKC